MDESLITSLIIGVFLITIIFSGVMGIILNYHWHRYESRNWRLRLTQTVYFLVSAGLFLIMAGLAAMFLF